MKSFFKGFFIAGSIASAIALLTAKKNGEETRQELSEKIDLSKALIKRANQTKKAVSEVQNVSVPYITDTLDDVKQRIQQFTVENRPRFRRIQEKLEVLQTHIAKRTDDE